MTLVQLQEIAFAANQQIRERQLAILTWGNASAFDPDSGLMAIKPSGVAYAQMTPADMVVLSVETGRPVEGMKLKPSSDTATHRVLYQAFGSAGVRGVVHTHSPKATAWAQAGRDLPCFGTTHADYFYGPVPCTPCLTEEEVHRGAGYEHNTGTVIVRTFSERGLDPLQMPAVLVCNHAPFVWGTSAGKAVENAQVLEEVAKMALDTLAIRATTEALAAHILDKHFLRKHGATAYYGQETGVVG